MKKTEANIIRRVLKPIEKKQDINRKQEFLAIVDMAPELINLLGPRVDAHRWMVTQFRPAYNELLEQLRSFAEGLQIDRIGCA